MARDKRVWIAAGIIVLAAGFPAWWGSPATTPSASADDAGKAAGAPLDKAAAERHQQLMEQMFWAFRGEVQVYLSPQQVSEKKPALDGVKLSDVFWIGERTFVSFRQAGDASATWVIPVDQIVAAKVTRGEPKP